MWHHGTINEVVEGFGISKSSAVYDEDGRCFPKGDITALDDVTA